MPAKAKDLQGNLKAASVMAIFEFPINAKPEEKSAAVTCKGPLFTKEGVDDTKAALYPCAVANAENQTRLSKIVPNEDLRGVFVRRNIPFVVGAMSTDNGDKYSSAAENECYILDKSTGDKQPLTGGSYLFRKPNYPRSEYADQPEFEFVMECSDKDDNKTEVRLPLYVVNTQASFEGGRTE